MSRLTFLIFAMASLAIVVVHLRSERIRVTSRTLALEQEWMALRTEWWSLQSRVSRLRSPERIRERVWQLGREFPKSVHLVPAYVDVRMSLHRGRG